MVGPDGVDRPVGQCLPQRPQVRGRPQRRSDEVTPGVRARISAIIEQQVMRAGLGNDLRAAPGPRQPYWPRAWAVDR
jgi:hypothetical protein